MGNAIKTDNKSFSGEATEFNVVANTQQTADNDYLRVLSDPMILAVLFLVFVLIITRSIITVRSAKMQRKYMNEIREYCEETNRKMTEAEEFRRKAHEESYKEAQNISKILSEISQKLNK